MKVDAANGVGGASVKRVMEEVRSDLVTVRLYNDGSGVLNDRVRLLPTTRLTQSLALHLSPTVTVWS